MGGLFRALLIGWLACAAGASAAETGVTETTIKVGMSSPFSGPNGAYGLDMKEVIGAYFEQVNKGGGVHGRTLELVALDDGYETERTVANARKLITEEKVFALLQFYGSSPTTQAMNDVFGPAKVPLVGTISGAGTLREPVSQNPNNRYMFNVRASYADETAGLVNQLVGLGINKIAVFYQNDGFGKSGLEGTTAALAKHGLAPTVAATVERNSLDVTEAVRSISATNPQAVIMVTLYKPTAAFVKAMRAAGPTPQFMTLSPVGADLLVQELGDDARGVGISQVMPYPLTDSVPVSREYRRLIKARGGNYSYYGIEAYVTARVFVEALRRTGKDLNREALVQTLERMEDAGIRSYPVKFTPDGRSGSSFVDISVIGPGGRVLR
jgi:ABC-type branched-subunit amino acid transport system substrate-binding protein